MISILNLYRNKINIVMDLIQPPLHNNSTCGSLTSMTLALESSTSITNNQAAITTSATIGTTNSISATVAHNNDIMTSESPRTSPTNLIVNTHHQKSQSLHHHHNHTQNLVTQKSNQVSFFWFFLSFMFSFSNYRM